MTTNAITRGFDEIDGIKHGFFSRIGGVSEGIYSSLNCGILAGDKYEHVLANRKIVAEAMGVELDNLLFLQQVHSNKVIKVSKRWSVDKEPKADAMVTSKKGVALGVLSADCAPVLIASKKDPAIGALHAGWKGALSGIVENTIEEMKEMGCKPADLEAVIGPCIGFNSYEVREDFRDNFLKGDKKSAVFFKASPRDEHLLFNLPGYITDKLKKLGVKTVLDVVQDTLINEANFYSCRRSFLKSRDGFGLQASVIMIED